MDRFDAFSTAPLVGSQGEADLCALVFADSQARGSYQFIVRDIGQREHVFTALVIGSGRDSRFDDSFYLLNAPRLETQMPGRVAISVHLVQVANVICAKFAQEHGFSYSLYR